MNHDSGTGATQGYVEVDWLRFTLPLQPFTEGCLLDVFYFFETEFTIILLDYFIGFLSLLCLELFFLLLNILDFLFGLLLTSMDVELLFLYVFQERLLS